MPMIDDVAIAGFACAGKYSHGVALKPIASRHFLANIEVSLHLCCIT